MEIHDFIQINPIHPEDGLYSPDSNPIIDSFYYATKLGNTAIRNGKEVLHTHP